MEKINIGIMGLSRGEQFLLGFKTMKDVCIKAVCESNSKIVERLKPKMPEETIVFDNFDDFIECGLDAVVLANYFHEHTKYAIIALDKGIHVLSETTAAATLGECVQLCEAVERSGSKYMLSTNTPCFNGCRELDRLYKEGSFGRVLYAEGEYFHAAAPGDDHLDLMPSENHWRRWLPRTYYNMHDLGTLMRITETVPRGVNARANFAPDVVSRIAPLKNSGDTSAFMLTEMDNGAIFRTTSCASLGPNVKWFRINCEKGCMETKRWDLDTVRYAYNDGYLPEGKLDKVEYPAPAMKLTEEQLQSGHGGTDCIVYQEFIDYINGKTTPFFDVYKSVALSAAGILAWYSVLDNGNYYEIPDFTDKEARKVVADDFRTPFPNPDGSGITLPCSSKPYKK